MNIESILRFSSNSLTKIGDDKGIHIPRGTIVNIPIWGIHHNPAFWENPEEFNPDRYVDSPRTKVFFVTLRTKGGHFDPLPQLTQKPKKLEQRKFAQL